MMDPSGGDVLDEWLSSPPLGTVTDPIAWWTAMEAAGHPLSRMSLDFMSALGMCCTSLHMPVLKYPVATSTDIERAFSHGSLTVSKMCHSLSDESVRAATVLGSWCPFPDTIPRDEIEASFRDKAKRPKVKESTTSASDVIAVDSE
jgi:hypothetical protein